MATTDASALTGRTAWTRSLETPLLLAATVAARLWVNLDAGSYEGAWSTELAIRVGDSGVTLSGTPTFFINCRRHYGAYDVPTLRGAVVEARARAFVGE